MNPKQYPQDHEEYMQWKKKEAVKSKKGGVEEEEEIAA